MHTVNSVGLVNRRLTIYFSVCTHPCCSVHQAATTSEIRKEIFEFHFKTCPSGILRWMGYFGDHEDSGAVKRYVLSIVTTQAAAAAACGGIEQKMMEH